MTCGNVLWQSKYNFSIEWWSSFLDETFYSQGEGILQNADRQKQVSLLFIWG